jgi:hypothetical protein
MPAKKKFKF